ncbi:MULTISPECIES: hypothetical protein [unclassified Streptomyces]|uniref:hypothetical protein n=1 Tax=unclassified Streptomyces TaxID=2593676 RepID=UPI003BB48F21
MPTTPQEAATAATRAAEAHATAGAPWPDAVHHTVRSLIRRLAIARGLAAPDLPYPACPDAEAALDELGPLNGWGIFDVGEVHQLLLELTPTVGEDGAVRAVRQGQGRRDAQGAWYTPPEVAAPMCRMSIGAATDLIDDPEPAAILRLAVIDPACGAGVFLIESARYVANLFAARVFAPGPAPAAAVQAALPMVMADCLYGVDIDPVGVDLTRAELWRGLHEASDAVWNRPLAVLPAPVDRAAVLHEAADAIEAEQHRLDDQENERRGGLSKSAAAEHVAVHRAAATLRLMADEEQQP